MTYLCMSWDHRALDGALAAQFLASALRKRDLEQAADTVAELWVCHARARVDRTARRARRCRSACASARKAGRAPRRAAAARAPAGLHARPPLGAAASCRWARTGTARRASTSSTTTAAASSPTTAPASSSATRSCAIADVVAYVRTMERAIVAALAEEGVERAAARDGRDYTGVWVEDRKIASIGVHVSRGVTDARLRGQRRQRPRAVRVGRALRARRRADDLGRRETRRGRRRPRRASARRMALAFCDGVRPPPAARHPGAAGSRDAVPSTV